MSQHKHLYNSARWKRLRLAQLRAHPLCEFDLKQGLTVGATVADHVVPHRGDVALFFGGQLQSLCATCHSAHKQAQEHNADGILRGAGHDGTPLDQAHHWHRPALPPAGVGGANVWEASGADRSVPSVCTPAILEGGG